MISADARRVSRNGRTVERQCERCGVTFHPTAYKVSLGRGRFCSTSCSSSWKWEIALGSHDFKGEGNFNFKGWSSRDQARYARLARARRPERAKAHDAVKRAVQSGRLVRPSTCEACGLTPETLIHGHHDDYSQPLAVKWLCRLCHTELHRAIRLAEAAA